MKEQAQLTLVGKVAKELGGYRMLVTFDGGHEAICVVCGKMRSRKIFVAPGDTVECELSSYDLTRGRIVFRGQR